MHFIAPTALCSFLYYCYVINPDFVIQFKVSCKAIFFPFVYIQVYDVHSLFRAWYCIIGVILSKAVCGVLLHSIISGHISIQFVLLFSKNSFDKTRFEFFAKTSITPRVQDCDSFNFNGSNILCYIPNMLWKFLFRVVISSKCCITITHNNDQCFLIKSMYFWTAENKWMASVVPIELLILSG